MDLTYEMEADHPVQIGLIVLQADESIERDFRRLLPDSVELLTTRVPSGTSVTSETLSAMEGALSAAAGLFPRGVSLAAVGYGCTSGTAQIGAARVAAKVRSGVPTNAVTEPVSALIAACKRLGVHRLGIVSPYIAEVSSRLRDVLEEAGITVTAFASFNEAEESKVVRISSASIVEGATRIGASSECDAVFISCTNLRTLEAIEKVEGAIGKPVLSSNQVLAWHMCEIAGVNASSAGPGRLFKHQ